MNEIRPAITWMRDHGNRGVITAKICEDLHIGKAYFADYEAAVKDLFESCCKYAAMKNSPNRDPDQLKVALAEIFPKWKRFLSCGEIDRYSEDLTPVEDDVYNLVGFCQVFMNSQNDYSLGEDEFFVATKQWANEEFKKFRKKVETDLGIRIAKIDVMSDERRDYLRKERSLLNTMKKAKSGVADANASIKSLEDLKSELGGEPAATAAINSRIAKLIATRKEAVEKFNEAADAIKKLGVTKEFALDIECDTVPEQEVTEDNDEE